MVSMKVLFQLLVILQTGTSEPKLAALSVTGTKSFLGFLRGDIKKTKMAVSRERKKKAVELEDFAADENQNIFPYERLVSEPT